MVARLGRIDQTDDLVTRFSTMNFAHSGLLVETRDYRIVLDYNTG